MKSLHVLVTSASKKIPLLRAVMQAAKRLHPDNRVTAGDTDPWAPARYVADDFLLMPRSNPEEIPVLLAAFQAERITTILPTRNEELIFWAENRMLFEAEGIQVIAPQLPALRLSLDKLAFAEFGLRHGFPIVFAATNLDEIERGPYVVKERFGSGSRGIGLRLDRQEALRCASAMRNPIYQSYIEGREISVDAWLDRHGRVKGLVPRWRDRVIDGESQITTTFRDVALEKMCVNLLEGMKLSGAVVLQAMIDRDGLAHVIECNPRFGGASTTAIAVGLDLFFWSLLESCGAEMKAYPFCRSSEEVRQIRIPYDIHIVNPHLQA